MITRNCTTNADTLSASDLLLTHRQFPEFLSGPNANLSTSSPIDYPITKLAASVDCLKQTAPNDSIDAYTLNCLEQALSCLTKPEPSLIEAAESIHKLAPDIVIEWYRRFAPAARAVALDSIQKGEPAMLADFLKSGFAVMNLPTHREIKEAGAVGFETVIATITEELRHQRSACNLWKNAVRLQRCAALASGGLATPGTAPSGDLSTPHCSTGPIKPRYIHRSSPHPQMDSGTLPLRATCPLAG